MINYLLDLGLCGLIVMAEIFIAIVGLLLIQLFFYRVLGINLYKNLFKSLDKLDNYLEEKF